MTIKRLKKMLKGVPDNTRVYMRMPHNVVYDECVDRVHIEKKADGQVDVVLYSDFENCI